VKLLTLNDVLVDQISDMLSAEDQLVRALPDVAAAVWTPELRDAFDDHLDETRGHVARLEQVAAHLGMPRAGHDSHAMQSMIHHVREIIAAGADPVARDVALIGAAQRIEHYEIAAYGTARELARQLGLDEVPGLLDQTLEEESAADSRLTKIAAGGFLSRGVNAQAAQ
jgi:ferritin-like metal-binding protein YciE